jgi:hypothetical protein
VEGGAGGGGSGAEAGRGSPAAGVNGTPGPGGAGGAPGGAGEAPAPVASCAPLPRRIWKLTAEQYSRTVQKLVPGVEDLAGELAATVAHREGHFLNEAGRQDFSQPHFDLLYEMARRVAVKATRNPAELHPCLGSGIGDQACVRGFLSGFVTKAFRRPAEPVEIDRLMALWKSSSDPREALFRTIQAILISTDFLFRTELGSPISTGSLVRLTPYERATTLSYFVANGPPDEVLLEVAGKGELETKEQIEAQARRLLRDPAAARGLVLFFGEQLDPAGVLEAAKDSKRFPKWNENLKVALLEESLRFFEEVLFRGDCRLSTLFTADFSMLNARTAPLYGARAVGETFARIPLPAGQRSGLLTQASFLARYASGEETSIVLRGKFVRERILCHEIPPPPPDVVPLPDRREGASMRDRMIQHATDPRCRSCHSTMDPIGFAFENYDAVGAYQTVDAGKPVDASGEVTGVAGGSVRFANALELGKLLAELPEVQRCMLGRLADYGLGVHGSAEDACRMDAVEKRFVASNGNLHEAVVALVTSDDFFVRAR